MNTLSLPRQLLSASQIEDIRLAASKMHGAERRAFQAEMSLKYCEGNVRLTETIFGWGRETVTVGLAEKRTGADLLWRAIGVEWKQTLGGPPSRGGGSAASVSGIACATRPDLSHGVELYLILQLVEAIQQLLSRRIQRERPRLSASAMAEILNRMGYRLRKVVKAKPQKKNSRNGRDL